MKLSVRFLAVTISALIPISAACPTTPRMALANQDGSPQATESSEQVVRGERPNVLLITIEALRPDHLGCYGYGKNTSPNFDRLARNGVRFTNSFSQSSWTSPSMASLFTSKYPSVHGVLRDVQRPSPTHVIALASQQRDKLHPNLGTELISQDMLRKSHVTLAEALRQQGYFTAGYSTNFHLAESTGFKQGFDTFVEQVWVPAEVINESVFTLLEEMTREPRSPFFIWIHYFDPHWPYDSVKIYEDLSDSALWWFPRSARYLGASRWFAYMRMGAYDNEIRYNDEQLDLLIEKLREGGLFDNTLLVVTADHGEAFGEHWSEQHGFSLYGEETRVPLLFFTELPLFPGGTVIDQAVCAVDIMPTILDLMDVPVPDDVQGRSLVPLMLGQSDQDSPVYLELNRFYDTRAIIERLDGDLYKLILNVSEAEEMGVIESHLERPMLAARVDFRRQKSFLGVLRLWYQERRYKSYQAMKRSALYNLSKDPYEQRNLIDSEPEIARQLELALERFSQSEPVEVERVERAITTEQAEKLKALGYLR